MYHELPDMVRVVLDEHLASEGVQWHEVTAWLIQNRDEILGLMAQLKAVETSEQLVAFAQALPESMQASLEGFFMSLGETDEERHAALQAGIDEHKDDVVAFLVDFEAHLMALEAHHVMDNGHPSVEEVYGHMQAWMDQANMSFEDLLTLSAEEVIAHAEQALNDFGISHSDAAQWLKDNRRNLEVVLREHVSEHAEHILHVLHQFVEKHDDSGCGGPNFEDVANMLNDYINASGMEPHDWLDATIAAPE